MRIALTGGGTGGHLFPIIAVAREIRKLEKETPLNGAGGAATEFMFLGPTTMGEETLAQDDIKHKKILAGKFRRYFSGQNIIDVLKLPGGFLQSLWRLFFFMPNVVFSKGGYGSLPVVLAAWLYRIPILIHESDSVPGLANKVSAKFSRRVAISFVEAAQYFPPQKTALTGNPVRASLFGGSREEAQRLLGISGSKPVILILGGSQGAQALNEVTLAALSILLNRCEIIHQCGAANYESQKQLMGNKLPPGYFLFPFLNEEQMRQAYTVADLVISRAGAGTIAEIAALGKASIIIPLPNSAGEHQQKNAVAFAQTGATVLMEQTNLTPHLFQSEILSLLDKPDVLKRMGEDARKFAYPDAARQIAQEIINIAKH